MLPGSLNLPVRRREEKGRRIEGKSQNHRGTTKSKIVPTSVALPSKTPSPATNPSTHIPPPVMIPPVTTVPLPMSNVLKDPTAMSPNLPGGREGKVIKRKIKEPETKPPPPPPKATIRKKKSSASEAKSISIDGKTSSEHEAGGVLSNNGKKKKRSQTSTDSGRKLNDKSEGSKEPSSNDEKTPKRFNKEMAQSFFKLMLESQKSKKRTDDARLETMPESSQINSSARSLRKNRKKTAKSEKDTNFFKPNGDPVWMVPEKPAGECERNEDGTPIKNPDLVAALAEDDLELEEKNWLTLINSYMESTLLPGKGLPEGYTFDPMGPIEKLEQLNVVFEASVDPPYDTLTYNTIKNLVDLSEIAMKRFQLKERGLDEPERPLPTPTHPRPAAASGLLPSGSPKPSENSTSLPNMPPKATVSTELFQLNTCLPQPVLSFDLKRCVSIKYDRQHPRASIKKFRKRLSYSMEQTTQIESKEKT